MTDAERLRSETRRNFLLEGKLTKVIVITALPQVTAMLIDALYNMADTFFVSQLGDAAIAAVGINDSLMMIIRAVAMGFGIGASSFISRALGAKHDEDASRAATTTLYTSVSVMVLLAVGFSIYLEPLVTFLGATENIRPYTMDYARWILVSAPITAATVCLSQLLRSEGTTTYAMIGSVSGCVINVILDPIFITTLELGVAGAAIATGLSKVISLIVLLLPYIRRKCIISLKFSYFSPTKAIYSEIVKMGVPTVLRVSMMSLSQIVINNIAGSFSDSALTAISVANKSMKFVASAILGFGQGFQPIAGYSWGAKKYTRVLKSFWYTALIGSVIGVVLGALLILFTDQVILIFTTDADVLKLGRILIISQSVMLVPHVLAMIATSLCQALGKPISAGILGLSRQLISLIPAVIILSRLFGLLGLVYSQAVADGISFVLGTLISIPVIRQLKRLEREQLFPD